MDFVISIKVYDWVAPPGLIAWTVILIGAIYFLAGGRKPIAAFLFWVYGGFYQLLDTMKPNKKNLTG